jgi:hypothetical protein
MNDIIADDNGAFLVTGLDPQLVVTIGEGKASKDFVGLDFEFNCNGEYVTPAGQVYWKLNPNGYSEENSLSFTTSQGSNSITFNAPVLADEFRLDIGDAESLCTKMEITNLTLK